MSGDDAAEQLRKELEKFMPKFNKPQKSSIGAGILAWIILALAGCAIAWIVGAIIGFGVSGYHLILRLIG